jgi:hypothetical protein
VKKCSLRLSAEKADKAVELLMGAGGKLYEKKSLYKDNTNEALAPSTTNGMASRSKTNMPLFRVFKRLACLAGLATVTRSRRPPDQPFPGRKDLPACPAELTLQGDVRDGDDRLPATRKPLWVRGKGLPESTERHAQAGERRVALAAVPARAVTKATEHPAAQRLVTRLEQG